MNEAERVVLEEMKRVLAVEAEKNSQTGTREEIDYTQVPDGELLKCLRARRFVLQQTLLMHCNLIFGLTFTYTVHTRLVVADAITLMKSSVPYRTKNNLYNISIADVHTVCYRSLSLSLPDPRSLCQGLWPTHYIYIYIYK